MDCVEPYNHTMKIHTFTYSCILNTDIENAFAFHTDPRNLPRITPPWIKVDIISMLLPLKEKSILELAIKRFGITTEWKIEIDSLKCPNTLIDLMVSGPFRYFKHERHFISLNNNETLMNETLSIVLPFGALGNLFYPWIKKQIDAMFEFRHIETQRHFLKK